MPKILVADDNTNIQKMVSLALEERGISVVAVGNGEAAVRRIPDLDPDLVLADIFMPVRNGYEVCEFVKKDERFAHVPVILLVGAFDPLDEKEARRVGADGVLKKPFVPPDPLIAMVTAALEKNPRVAAELAKAKEAKMAPQPEPIPSIEPAARSERKPLPEFPEPSPEEAALVYGFGKGVRPDTADEDVEDEDIGKGPVAVPSVRASEDDDEDEQSASKNWRRTAMDIEIPADVASKPAIPSMDDLEPMSFPSEKDYPPRRVTAPINAETARAEVKSETVSSSSGFSLRQVEDSDPGAIPIPERIASKAVPEPQPPMGLHPAHATQTEPEALPEPYATSAGGHWLDAVASADAGQLAGGWMDALNAEHPRARSTPDAEPVAREGFSDAAANESATIGVPAASGASLAQISTADSDSSQNGQVDEDKVEATADQSFFADESESGAAAIKMPELHGARESIASTPTADPDIELDADDSEPPVALKDPGLVEPPAVHVTPEPLLVDEDASGPAQYGSPAEEITPLHTFFEPASEVAAAAPAPAQASEFSVQPQSESSEPSAGEVNDRVPTMPPPNREALAHIPFLTPPPSFLAEMNAPQHEAHRASPETVDAVVQKVLEKLQPQLQELLSQGLLKPLVENLLQNELTKKP